MTTKITRAVAEKMATAIIKHAFKDEALPLLRRERALFKKVYDAQHPPELRTKMDELQDMLGEGQRAFVYDCNSIYARSASGYNNRLEMNPGFYGRRGLWSLALENCPLALFSFDGNTHRLTGDMSQELEAFCTDKQAFERKLKAEFDKAVGAVLAFGTYKKLQAGWPEVLPLVQQFIPVTGQSTALAVCVSDLNAAFKLPPNQTEGE